MHSIRCRLYRQPLSFAPPLFSINTKDSTPNILDALFSFFAFLFCSNLRLMSSASLRPLPFFFLYFRPLVPNDTDMQMRLLPQAPLRT